MSPPGSPVGLIITALAIFAGVMAVDSGAITVASRDLLVLGLLAAAWVAIQATLAWRRARAKADPVIFIREGTVRRSGGQIVEGGRLRSVTLAVESGQAVVLERGGIFSRVLRPGLSAMLPGETVYKVVSTQPRTLIGSVPCATRDGITVTIDFEVSAQIMPRADDGSSREAAPGAAPRVAGSPLPSEEPLWSEDALVRAAYETHSWESAVLGLSRSTLRDQFCRLYLSDFDLPAVCPRGSLTLESIQSRCQRRMAAAGRPMGISIQRFGIASLGIPSELSGGALAAERAPRPHGRLRGAQAQGADGAGRPSTAIRLAGVLGGGPFASFRQAMRSRIGDVIIPDVLIESHRWVGRALGQADPVPFDLLPDRMHYDIQIHGHGFQPAGLYSGDHLLFATLPAPAEGDIVAVVVDGHVELRRYSVRTDHILLEPERESQSALALAASDDLEAGLRARYIGSEPAIEVRSLASIKILGRAAIVFGLQPAAAGQLGDRVLPRVGNVRDPRPDATEAQASPVGSTAPAAGAD